MTKRITICTCGLQLIHIVAVTDMYMKLNLKPLKFFAFIRRQEGAPFQKGCWVNHSLP